MLSGINYPNNGKPIYQEDFSRNQELLAEEILNRMEDVFEGRILEGGMITEGSNPNSVNLEAVKGYDPQGRRFQIAALNNLNITIENAESFVVIRHKFNTETSSQLDATGYSNTFRINSHEVLFVTNPNPNDVQLARISSVLGVVTILEDLRSLKRLDGEKILENSLSNSKLANSIKIGDLANLVSDYDGNKDSLVNALNHIANLLSNEVSNRNTALDAKNYLRSVEATAIRFHVSGNLLYWSKDNGATWLPFA